MAAESRGRRRSGGLLGKLSERFSRPAEVGGAIEPSTRLVDPERALLLNEVVLAEVGMERADRGETVFGMELRGVLNVVGDPVNILVLASPDVTAVLVSQITALARGGRLGPEFDHCLAVRMEEALGL